MRVILLGQDEDVAGFLCGLGRQFLALRHLEEHRIFVLLGSVARPGLLVLVEHAAR